MLNLKNLLLCCASAGALRMQTTSTSHDVGIDPTEAMIALYHKYIDLAAMDTTPRHFGGFDSLPGGGIEYRSIYYRVPPPPSH